MSCRGLFQSSQRERSHSAFGFVLHFFAILTLLLELLYSSPGVEVGAYDLIGGTRHDNIPDKWIAVNNDPPNVKSVCLASGWYENIVRKVIPPIFKQRPRAKDRPRWPRP